VRLRVISDIIVSLRLLIRTLRFRFKCVMRHNNSSFTRSFCYVIPASFDDVISYQFSCICYCYTQNDDDMTLLQWFHDDNDTVIKRLFQSSISTCDDVMWSVLTSLQVAMMSLNSSRWVGHFQNSAENCCSVLPVRYNTSNVKPHSQHNATQRVSRAANPLGRELLWT